MYRAAAFTSSSLRSALSWNDFCQTGDFRPVDRLIELDTMALNRATTREMSPSWSSTRPCQWSGISTQARHVASFQVAGEWQMREARRASATLRKSGALFQAKAVIR